MAYFGLDFLDLFHPVSKECDIVLPASTLTLSTVVDILACYIPSSCSVVDVERQCGCSEI